MLQMGGFFARTNQHAITLLRKTFKNDKKATELSWTATSAYKISIETKNRTERVKERDSFSWHICPKLYHVAQWRPLAVPYRSKWGIKRKKNGRQLVYKHAKAVDYRYITIYRHFLARLVLTIILIKLVDFEHFKQKYWLNLTNCHFDISRQYNRTSTSTTN